MDLKAAFDTVKKEKLWTILAKLGTSKHYIERIKGIYEETIRYIRYNLYYISLTYCKLLQFSIRKIVMKKK